MFSNVQAGALGHPLLPLALPANLSLRRMSNFGAKLKLFLAEFLASGTTYDTSYKYSKVFVETYTVIV